MELGGTGYLDHASTSWPKAPGTREAMADALLLGGSPDRGSHKRARTSSEIVRCAREAVAELIGTSRPECVIFTPGATYALNLAIKGLGLGPDDHVVATCYDHNSVLRPLEQIRRRSDVSVSVVRSATFGGLIDAVAASLRPSTRLLTINHASNVTGGVLPADVLIELAQERGVTVLLDASQTAGHLSFTLETLPADLIAFGGHKALLGPPGVGCLVVGDLALELEPNTVGGTGHDSASADPQRVFPTSFEPGTANVPAIAGLARALDYLRTKEQAEETATSAELRSDCLDRLAAIPGVRVYSSRHHSVPVIAFNIDGIPPARASALLDQDHGLQSRPGLHCAPLTHEALNTGRQGSMRVSFGYGNTRDDVERLLVAVREIAKTGR